MVESRGEGEGRGGEERRGEKERESEKREWRREVAYRGGGRGEIYLISKFLFFSTGYISTVGIQK